MTPTKYWHQVYTVLKREIKEKVYNRGSKYDKYTLYSPMKNSTVKSLCTIYANKKDQTHPTKIKLLFQ
jgi:hypothetical protein